MLPHIQPEPGPRPRVLLLAAAGLALLDHGGQARQLLVRLLVVYLEAEEQIFNSACIILFIINLTMYGDPIGSKQCHVRYARKYQKKN